MWKLKIAEGHGPYLYSTNNFVGRQIWEYESDAGTPEERLAVEKAREEYRMNRMKGVHYPCGDLFMRMQLIKESGMDLLSIPPIRLEEDKEVNYEAVTTSMKKAVRLSRALQASDGHWPAENAGPMFFNPQLPSFSDDEPAEDLQSRSYRSVTSHPLLRSAPVRQLQVPTNPTNESFSPPPSPANELRRLVVRFQL
ncbi:cyclase [Lithospermum erythrorhizon]|uniref:Cyclase n=1 Tax=Lithospermum erythrorhizon TaxID=34254 RepID=A0AAV3RJQ0_LITER